MCAEIRTVTCAIHIRQAEGFSTRHHAPMWKHVLLACATFVAASAQAQVYRCPGAGPVVVQQRVVRMAPDCRTSIRHNARGNGTVVTSRTRTC